MKPQPGDPRKLLCAVLAVATATVASTIAFARPADDVAAEPTPPAMIDLRHKTAVRGDPVAGQQKSELCSACHGVHGIAVVPFFPNHGHRGVRDVGQRKLIFILIQQRGSGRRLLNTTDVGAVATE